MAKDSLEDACRNCGGRSSVAKHAAPAGEGKIFTLPAGRPECGGADDSTNPRLKAEIVVMKRPRLHGLPPDSGATEAVADLAASGRSCFRARPSSGFARFNQKTETRIF